jgi:hypothetical protein
LIEYFYKKNEKNIDNTDKWSLSTKQNMIKHIFRCGAGYDVFQTNLPKCSSKGFKGASRS